MSVKSLGFYPVSVVGGTYQFPQITLSSSNQITAISEDTTLENLPTSIAALQATADALLASAQELDTDIGDLQNTITELNGDIAAQATELSVIRTNLANINAILSIAQQPQTALSFVGSQTPALQGSVFQPNQSNQYGVLVQMNSGNLSVSSSGPIAYIFAVNMNLSWSTSLTKADPNQLQNGGKMLVQLVNSAGNIVYQNKQGMFNFNSSEDDLSRVGFSSSDVVILPSGTYSVRYACCSQTGEPTNGSNPDEAAQTAWQDASFYLEDNKSVQGFTYQIEAILYSV